MLTVGFMAMTLVMVPFAYLAAISKKIKLMRRKKSLYEEDDDSNSNHPIVGDLLIFIVAGLPLLMLAWLKDAFYFLKSTYRDDVKEFGFSDSVKEHTITEP